MTDTCIIDFGFNHIHIFLYILLKGCFGKMCRKTNKEFPGLSNSSEVYLPEAQGKGSVSPLENMKLSLKVLKETSKTMSRPIQHMTYEIEYVDCYTPFIILSSSYL